MYVDFRLPERFIGKIRREQTIEMQLDAMPGRQFKAKIEAIDPQLDANGRAVLVRAVLPNTGGEPLAQRPGGPGGSGGPGAAPAGAASGGKPADKPAAKPAARPAQRPASAPVAAAPRPVDPIAASCAQFTNAAVVARAAAGVNAAVGGSPAAAGAPSGRGAAGAAVTAGAAPSGGSGARVAAGAPGAGAGAGGGPLRPGMFARVTAVFNVKDAALTVPEEAIVPQGGRQFVIRVVEQTEAQGKEIADKQAADAAKAAEAAKAAAAASSAPAGAGSPAGAGGGGGTGGAQPYNMSGFVDGKRLVSQRVEVKLGIRRPGRVEITEGLMATDTVVVAGQQRLQRDSTPVRVIELGRSPGAPGGAPSGAAPGAASGATGGAPNAAQGSVGTAMPAASAPAPAASR
jgi:multidrug efflux pump subunit AcrA (membrane-fusion protein)